MSKWFASFWLTCTLYEHVDVGRSMSKWFASFWLTCTPRGAYRNWVRWQQSKLTSPSKRRLPHKSWQEPSTKKVAVRQTRQPGSSTQGTCARSIGIVVSMSAAAWCPSTFGQCGMLAECARIFFLKCPQWMSESPLDQMLVWFIIPCGQHLVGSTGLNPQNNCWTLLNSCLGVPQSGWTPLDSIVFCFGFGIWPTWSFGMEKNPEGFNQKWPPPDHDTCSCLLADLPPSRFHLVSVLDDCLTVSPGLVGPFKLYFLFCFVDFLWNGLLTNSSIMSIIWNVGPG